MKHLPIESALTGLICFTWCACQQPSCPPTGSNLRQAELGFVAPQDSARTKIWWFHGRYPASHEGMTADLEAFREAGIGGVVFYDQVHGEPDAGTPLTMSPEWWADVYHAARETHRLGLSMEMHVGSGFVAGGEWITPELAMKWVETVDTVIRGGGPVEIHMPHPENQYHYYRDIRLMAIPEPDAGSESTPLITSSLKGWNAERLFTSNKLSDIPVVSPDSVVVITLDYGNVHTLRSISYLIGPEGKATTSATNVPAPPSETFVGTGYGLLPPVGVLEWSAEGVTYHKVCDIKPLYRGMGSYKRKTLSFLPVSARYFRLRLGGWDGASEGRPLRLGGIELSSHAKINEVEYKAGYISDYIEKSMASPAYTASDVVALDNVIDLSLCMDSAGTLRWDAPEGRWRLLRICQVPTGGRIKHYRNGLTGQRLECNKMSVKAAQVQWEHYMGCILDSLERQGLGGYVSGMVMDSHEAGAQNWTDDLLQAFQRLRGYDLTPYLPVFSGYVVGDVATSEGVLYDLRQTLADLISERYYGTMDSLCHSRGIVLTAQATGNGQNIVAIPIEAKGRVDKPQGEFWNTQPDGNYDIKEASSSAHLYGQQIASGEAFTDCKLNHMPSDIKHMADAAYCYGINEFVVCASAYQPVYIPAGNPAGRCYSTFTRCNTWWNESRPLWDYQARVSNTLRQGRPVADLCILLGNNAPTRILTHRLPRIPAGYDFDACTEQALFTRLTVSHGHLTLPTGQSYRMLVLPRSGELTLDALRQIALFVRQGASVYGPRPTGSPSARDIGLEQEYQQLVSELWDQDNWGLGHVYKAPSEEELLQAVCSIDSAAQPQAYDVAEQSKASRSEGITLAEALQQAGIEPDIAGIELHVPSQDYANGSLFYFVHRELDDADIYFINNHADTLRTGHYTFRSRYHFAQWWDPLTGLRYSLPMSDDGSVYLELQGRESGFVVLADEEEMVCVAGQGQANNGQHNAEQSIKGLAQITGTSSTETSPVTFPVKPVHTNAQALEGEWTFCFNPYPGGHQKTIHTTDLTDWTKSDDPDLRHFSGTASYATTFTWQPVEGEATLLRLPANPCVTVVIVNGQRAGTIWASPWQVDLTPCLHEGTNDLRLEVTNSWRNRLVLDRQLPPRLRQIPHPEWFERESDNLIPAGIEGTVWLLRAPLHFEP